MNILEYLAPFLLAAVCFPLGKRFAKRRGRYDVKFATRIGINLCFMTDTGEREIFAAPHLSVINSELFEVMFFKIPLISLGLQSIYFFALTTLNWGDYSLWKMISAAFVGCILGMWGWHNKKSRV